MSNAWPGPPRDCFVFSLFLSVEFDASQLCCDYWIVVLLRCKNVRFTKHIECMNLYNKCVMRFLSSLTSYGYAMHLCNHCSGDAVFSSGLSSFQQHIWGNAVFIMTACSPHLFGQRTNCLKRWKIIYKMNTPALLLTEPFLPPASL